MFYLLDFQTHTFKTFNDIEKLIGCLQLLKKHGLDIQLTVEVIDCSALQARYTGEDFLKCKSEHTLKCCPRCGEVAGWDSHFQSYICQRCKLEFI